MKRIIPLVLGVFVLASFSGCVVGLRAVRGDGPVVEEERQVNDFSRVEFGTIGNLIIELGEQESLRIEAQENLLEYIVTEVRGGILEIGNERGVNIVPTEGVSYYLTVRELESVTLNGLGSIQIPGIETTGFSIVINGAGDIDVEDLDATTLDVDISGLGNLTVEEGEVEEQDIRISGGGDYNARDLDSARTEIYLSGLGSATVRVRDHLSVDISGGGSIQYIGDPTVEQNVSGVGHVERIEE